MRIFITCLLLILAVPLTGAARVHQVETEGVAPIIAGDVAQAKDEALTDARLKAVQQVVGVVVKARTVILKQLLVDSSLVTRSWGLVKRIQVLRQWRDADGLYHVRIKAWVSDMGLADRLMALLRNDRIVILTEETNLNKKLPVSILENECLTALHKIGYRHVMASFQVPGLSSRGGMNLTGPGRWTLARKWGLRFLGNVVFIGRIASRRGQKFTDNYYTARADGFLQVLRVRDRRVLAAVSLQAVRGFGNTPERAGRDALRKISRRLTVKALAGLTPLQYRRIRVVVRGLPTFFHFLRVKSLLKLMRWVRSVTMGGDGYQPRESIFYVEYAALTKILATRLGRMPWLKLDKFDRNNLEVTWRGLPR